MQLRFKTDTKSFAFLNITQFLGALNDNFFKLLVVFLLINVKGTDFASSILSITGAVFVAPFLLFSSGAGILADKLSKTKIIVGTKIFEAILMVLSLFAVYYKSEISLYTVLFLLASQSAVFGPSKYGIIPEIVESKKVSKANGIMNSMTYLAIILGTFLASFLTDISNKNFMLVGTVCAIIALLILLSSLNIAKVPPKGSQKKLNPFFLQEIYKTLSESTSQKHLLTNVFGSSFFLFVGGFTQLNIIPFGIQHLKLSEVGGGYLFLLTAIGIAIGSLIAGKMSKERIETGLACFSGFLLSLIFFLLFLFSANTPVTLLLLLLLGVAGGMFLIPFDAFIQLKSPDLKRGQIIAASNFLSFCGVLLAAVTLYLLCDQLKLSPAAGFGIFGILTLTFTIIISGKMADLFLPFLAKRILSHFYTAKIENLPDTDAYLVLNERSWLKALFLHSFLPDLKIFSFGKKFANFPFFNGFLRNIFLFPYRKSPEKMLLPLVQTLKKEKTRDNYACIMIKQVWAAEKIKIALEEGGITYPQVIFIKTKIEKKSKKHLFSKSCIYYDFSKIC